jgi:hypothetical protein
MHAKQERVQVVVRMSTALKERVVKLAGEYGLTGWALRAIKRGLGIRNEVLEQRWASRTPRGVPRVAFQIRMLPALRARVAAASAEAEVKESDWLLWAFEREATRYERLKSVEQQRDLKKTEILTVLAGGRDLETLRERYLEQLEATADDLLTREAAQEHVIYGTIRSTEPQTKLKRLCREFIALNDEHNRLAGNNDNDKAIERADQREVETHQAINRALESDSEFGADTELDDDEITALDDPRWKDDVEGFEIVDLSYDPEGRQILEAGYQIITRKGDDPLVDSGRRVPPARRPDDGTSTKKRIAHRYRR